MAKPYWYNQYDGFLLDGKGIHKEEIKRINARRAGLWDIPVKSKPAPDVIAHIASPEQYVPKRVAEPTPLAERVRDTRLDILQTLGELMLEADAA